MVRKYTNLYWIIPLIIYVLLFEFVLQLNNILPGPSLIIESLSALLNIYALIFNLFYTASGIYVSITAAYFLLYFTAGPSIAFIKRNNDALRVFSGLKYFPLAGFIVLFVFWFPVSNIAEYIFSITLSLVFLYHALYANITNVKTEYIKSALALGMSSSEIYSRVYWKSLQPFVFKNLIILHNGLWTIMIIFEIIKGDLGIGYIYKQALEYNDVSVIFTLSLIVMLVLFTGNIVLKYLSKKIIFWEN